MARVRISRQEAERGLLPQVCVLTGQPTSDVKRKSFLWQPPWVGVLILAGLLPYVIVSMMVRKSMALDLPLVKEKHGHWLWRNLVTWGGVLVCILLMVGGGVISAQAGRAGANRTLETVSSVMFVVGLVGFLVVLIVGVVLNNSAIRPSEITDRGITLVGVHKDFAAALEDERDRDEDEYRRQRDQDRERDRQYDDRNRRDTPPRRDDRPSGYDDRPRKARPVDDDDDYDRR